MFSAWVYWILTATYVLSIITVITVIIGENRNPLKSLAWVTVLLLLPAVGLILYVFFGRSIKNQKMISRRLKRRLHRHESYRPKRSYLNDLSVERKQLLRLTMTLTGGTFYHGNSIEIFTDGTSKFEKLKKDLIAAQSYIHLQYYIIESDNIGNELKEILTAKARDGVKVRIIYDHIGSIHVNKSFFRDMAEAGIEVYPFFKVTFTPLASRINWRNHRKIAVIDGNIGYIGGMNIADRYINGGKNFDLWRDCHVRLTGPAVHALQSSFAVDWTFMGFPPPEEDCSSEPTGSDLVQLVTSGPMNRWHNVAHVFQHVISSAHKRVWLQTPYFLPTESLLKALQTAALAGVDVRIMIPRRSDSRLLVHASSSFVTECLQSGIKVYFFNPGMLHSKVLIVDDDFVSIGSTNFDFRSFEHNFESNLLIYSKETSARMRDSYIADLKQSTRIIPAEWAERSWTERMADSLTRLLSPVL